MSNLQEKNKQEKKLEVKLNFQETETQKPVADWTKEDVQKWLKENGLNEKEVEQFSRRNGEDIANFTQEQWVMILGKVDGASFYNKICKLNFTNGSNEMVKRRSW